MRADAAEKDSLTLRRGMYTELYAAMRNYRRALLDYAVLTDAQAPKDAALDSARERVEQARAATADCYASAQMILPAPLLRLAHDAEFKLGDAYRWLIRTGEVSPASRDAVKQHTRLPLIELREALRADLGVPPAPAGSIVDV